MKLLIKFFLIIIILADFNSAQTETAPASSAEGDCRAELVVETDQNTSSILINDEKVGSGIVRTKLKNGKYVITAVEDYDRWNSKVYRDTVSIESCNDKKIAFNFNSDIYLQTEPEDVYVYNERDSLIGHSPLFISNSFNKLNLSKPGFESKTVAVNTLIPNEKIKLRFTGVETGKSFFEKDLFKYLLGGIVVLGGATAYFKLKADDKFEDYQFTGDQKLLDQTRRYDLISGISFTALQINFGLLLYYFLTD